MLRSHLRLKKSIGRNYSVDPDDTLRTKTVLKDLGYFERPSYGITPYPDESLFKGIEQFQDDFDLHRDGVMEPNGETVKKLNEALKYKHRTSNMRAQRAEEPHSSGSPVNKSGQKAPSNGEKEREPGGEQMALAPAVPVIIYEIAALFGMTVAAAYTWWLTLSGEKRNQIRAQVFDAQERGSTESRRQRMRKIVQDRHGYLSPNCKKTWQAGGCQMLCFCQREIWRVPGWKAKGPLAAAGYMEQLDAVVYRFSAFARSKDGTVEELSVAVSAPVESGKGDSVCLLSCPLLRAKPFSIYGVDHDQALELSRRFVELGLEYRDLELVDAEGTRIELPPAPKADDLIAPDRPI